MSGGASAAGLGGLDDDGVVVVSATGGGGDPVPWRGLLDRAAAHLAPLSSVRVPIGEARAAMLTARRLENELWRFRRSCEVIIADHYGAILPTVARFAAATGDEPGSVLEAWIERGLLNVEWPKVEKELRAVGLDVVPPETLETA